MSKTYILMNKLQKESPVNIQVKYFFYSNDLNDFSKSIILKIRFTFLIFLLKTERNVTNFKFFYNKIL